MNTITTSITLYSESVERLPKEGNHIIGRMSADHIIVYQAFKNSTADYAVKHQVFGGSDYSYNRMSWIKTSFLWMMFRSGWAQKEGQERILAITLRKEDFELILGQSAHASFQRDVHGSENEWKQSLQMNEGRLQWDPDHDPFGNVIARRAIQLGLKGSMLKQFGLSQIVAIEDITAFVKEQYQYVGSRQLDKLKIPLEDVFIPQDPALKKKIGLTLL